MSEDKITITNGDGSYSAEFIGASVPMINNPTDEGDWHTFAVNDGVLELCFDMDEPIKPVYIIEFDDGTKIKAVINDIGDIDKDGNVTMRCTRIDEDEGV